MKTHSSFQLLIELSQTRVDEAAEALGRSTQARNQAQAQLDALHEYRQDYADRLTQAGQNGLAMANYTNFRRFIGTLDDALYQQNKIIASLNAEIASHQSTWQHEQQQLKAYQTLLDRRHAEQRHKQAKAEQRFADEMSTAMFLRKQHSY